jgi:uncharacterized membrane protein
MSAPGRVQAIDRLRGLVMVLMALDHTRDFFQPQGVSPEDLATTTPAFFFIRWITHFCAPVFVLLAGSAARLAHERHGDSAQTASFLVRRGLWLMLLEATVITGSWFFGWERIHLGVVWAIGGAMVLLGGAVRLGLRGGTLGILGVVGTLALAAWPVAADSMVGLLFHPRWTEPAWSPVPIQSVYAIVPWFLVMAGGWGIGPALADPRRRSLVASVGLLLLGTFLLVRIVGWGDPRPAEPQATAALTVIDFLRLSKYPPSLGFLTMTLGPALVLLSQLHRWRGPLSRAVLVFGQVPLFFYLLHIPFIHLVGLVHAWLRFGDAHIPAEQPLSLLLIVGAWLGFVAVLWPVCALYRELKRSGRHAWTRWL